MTIPTLPTSPSRTMSQDTFDSTVDAFLAALPATVTAMNTDIATVNSQYSATITNAAAAAASATSAAASALSAAGAAGASAWVSGTTYAIGDVRYSPVNYLSYRRITAGAGATDPSADTTNWVRIVEDTMPYVMSKDFAMCVDLTSSATVGGLTAADNANLDQGTNNFTLAITAALPDYTPSADVIMLQKTDGTNGYKLSLLTTGLLRLTINTTNYDSTVATGLTDGVMATFGAVVTRSSATAAGSVVFKVNDVTKGASVAIAQGAPVTVDNASAFYIGGTATTRYAMRYKSCRIFNRALTDAQWVDFVRNGVAFADIGAAQTTLNVSTCVNAGGAYAYDSFTGASNTGFTAVKTTFSSVAFCGTADEISLVAGKFFVVEFDAVINSGTAPYCLFEDAHGSTNLGYMTPQIITSGRNVLTGVPSASTTGVITFFTTASSYANFTISNLRVRRGGAAANYDTAGIQPNQVHDSANDNHLSFPTSGATLSLWKETGQYNWTTAIAGDTTLTSIVPAGHELEKIVFKNSTAGAVSVRLGTTAGGTEVFGLTALNTSATFGGHKTVLVNQGFSATAAQTLYLSSTDWTGGGTPPSLVFTMYFRRIS